MICTEAIYLCTKGVEIYNEDTGDYEESQPIRIRKTANINDMADEKVGFLFGETVESALTMRVMGHFDNIDFIEYKGRKYEIVQSRKVKHKQIFQVRLSKWQR